VRGGPGYCICNDHHVNPTVTETAVVTLIDGTSGGDSANPLSSDSSGFGPETASLDITADDLPVPCPGCYHIEVVYSNGDSETERPSLPPPPPMPSGGWGRLSDFGDDLSFYSGRSDIQRIPGCDECALEALRRGESLGPIEHYGKYEKMFVDPLLAQFAAVSVAGGVAAAALIESGVAEVGTTAIRTKYALEVQDASAEAQAALAEARAGATLYRVGQLGESMTGESQYWSLTNPLTEGYVNGIGMPAVTPDFIMGGTLAPDALAITNEAAALGANAGGAIQVVTSPGGVTGLWFSML